MSCTDIINKLKDVLSRTRIVTKDRGVEGEVIPRV